MGPPRHALEAARIFFCVVRISLPPTASKEGGSVVRGGMYPWSSTVQGKTAQKPRAAYNKYERYIILYTSNLSSNVTDESYRTTAIPPRCSGLCLSPTSPEPRRRRPNSPSSWTFWGRAPRGTRTSAPGSPGGSCYRARPERGRRCWRGPWRPKPRYRFSRARRAISSRCLSAAEVRVSFNPL